MLPQLKTTDLYNIPIDNVKILAPICFDKERFVLHYENLFEARIKARKINRVLDFNQSHWLKPYIDFNTQKE